MAVIYCGMWGCALTSLPLHDNLDWMELTESFWLVPGTFTPEDFD